MATQEAERRQDLLIYTGVVDCTAQLRGGRVHIGKPGAQTSSPSSNRRSLAKLVRLCDPPQYITKYIYRD